jgi:hypothetical protein
MPSGDSVEEESKGDSKPDQDEDEFGQVPCQDVVYRDLMLLNEVVGEGRQ